MRINTKRFLSGKVVFLVVLCLRLSSLHGQIITTIAGNGNAVYSGDGGPATAAGFSPYGVAVDDSGNVYIADGNGRIRKVSTSGIINTIIGNGYAGYSGDGGPASAAEIAPYGIAIDKTGNIFIAEPSNNRIRKVNTSGIINTLAGNGVQGYYGDGGPATLAELNQPAGIKVDKVGNVYIADGYNQVIRKVDTSGIISTIAGNGFHTMFMDYGGYSGDGGPATSAELDRPRDVDFDDSGNVYIADWDNYSIRKVNSSGIISTFAGIEYSGYFGDGGPATSAELDGTFGVTVNDSGVYIVDNANHRVRKVNSSGIINTFAGNGIGGYYGDGGPATSAELYPVLLASDNSGNIFISDGGNNRVWKVTVILKVLSNLINNVSCSGADNGSATTIASEGTNPYTYTWSPNGGSNAIATGLSAGTYTVMVIDSNNLKGSATVAITQPTALDISAFLIANSNCYGGNNGSASSITSGGTAPYTYLWSDANRQTTVSATGLLAGIYTLTATDNNGCTDSAIVSISQPTAIIPNIMEYEGIKCNGDSDAVIFADATGGSGFYAYSWSDASSQATPLATGLSAGNYTVTVTDNNGCNGTTSATITCLSPPLFGHNFQNGLGCFGLNYLSLVEA